MPLKYKYKKADEVPADHKTIYVEKEVEDANGTKEKVMVLDVEGVVEREKLVEFRDKNVVLLQERDTLKEKLKDIDDPDKARALLKIAKDVEVEDAEKYLKKGGVDAIILERTKTIREDLEGKLKTANEKVLTTAAQLDRTIIENHILGICSKLPLQQGAEVAILKLAEGVWVRKDNKIVSLDNSGNPRPSKDGTANLEVTEWLQEDLLKKHQYLIKESSGGGAAGSGSGGSGGSNQSNVNPWKKETWNLTLQGRLLKEDRAKASRLAAAAGQKLPGET